MAERIGLYFPQSSTIDQILQHVFSDEPAARKALGLVKKSELLVRYLENRRCTMKLCQDHWHELKNAIRQRGMWKFVPPDGPLKANRATHYLDARTAPLRFDPLTMASMLISHQALTAFGDYLKTRNYCPLCEVEQNLGTGISMEWIDVNADTLLELCRERHLISSEE